MIRLYGIPGCGPCEVAKLYLARRGVSFSFTDLSDDAEARQRLAERLGSLRSGVILEDDGHLEVMQGVSPAKLEGGYRAHLARRRSVSRAQGSGPYS